MNKESESIINRLYGIKEALDFNGDLNHNRDEAIDKAIEALSKEPTIPHGKWILKQRGKYVDIVCSKCGYARVKEYAYNYTVKEVEKDGDYKNSVTSICFCENCGAYMRGGRSTMNEQVEKR